MLAVSDVGLNVMFATADQAASAAIIPVWSALVVAYQFPHSPLPGYEPYGVLKLAVPKGKL
jgi:hypothetical protein